LSILTKYNMGGILADDMGLGKTIQVIALLKSDRSRKPSLVVCPKSLIFNWLSEFARFDGTMKVAAIYGPDSRRSEIIAGIDGKERAVYITSYDSLRNDITKYTGEFNYVILDEAQYIKNVNAQKTKSVKELKASHRFALTGTPIENSVIDLWSIFDFIMPGYFEELSKFQDTEHAAIARKAGPFILRRVKEDVLEDLPAKYERILSTDMSDGQRKLYDAMRQEARKALEEGGKAFDLLPYLTRLRQVCVDPGMFAEGYQGGSGKMEMLKTLIPEYLENHHRILIFSQFVKALEGVREMLNRQGIPTYFLSGATPAKDRVEMMDSFNNGSGTDVFLISLKAGGTGLNLTGADTVIHLDPWWNVAAENQASDRTHRIGQTRNVEVIKLIAGESIEQRVVELQDMKKEVIKQVISDDDGSVTSASLEDIAFVLD
ncbi:MAG: DEAD/DEAH box helicase, partial [Clostridia bacterium]|nr:DEAD/DEAH box helicase [Clostridia bacterium]